MGEASDQTVAIIQNDLKHLGRNHDRLENKVDKNHKEVTESLGGIEDKMTTLLQFMAAQEEKNESAERERDRIFKASTLLPVAILTSVISGGVSYIMKTEPVPIQTPTQQTYIVPQRAEQKPLPLTVISK